MNNEYEWFYFFIGGIMIGKVIADWSWSSRIKDKAESGFLLPTKYGLYKVKEDK